MKSIHELQAIVNQIANEHDSLDTMDKLNHALSVMPEYSDCMLDILRDALRRRYLADSGKSIDKFIAGLS